METTLFELKLYDGRIFRIFCKGKNQHQRFLMMHSKLKNEIESLEEISNGIHTITEFEKITTNLL